MRPPSSEVLRKHWGTVAPIAPASLIQGQAWTVIADIPRLWALHARTPTTASHCHLLLEPPLHPQFFDNTIPRCHRHTHTLHVYIVPLCVMMCDITCIIVITAIIAKISAIIGNKVSSFLWEDTNYTYYYRLLYALSQRFCMKNNRK